MTQDIIKKAEAKEIVFKDVLSHIEQHYHYTPSAFQNGSQRNGSQENQGSAKVLYFAKMNQISKEQTLHLFVEHYESVLNTPDGIDHQNIRQFMLNGWDGVQFEQAVLVAK